MIKKCNIKSCEFVYTQTSVVSGISNLKNKEDRMKVIKPRAY